MTRIATALVLIPAMVGLALFAPLWALAAALGLAGAFAMLEYDRIAQAAFAGIWPRLAGIVYVFGPLACAILLWRIGRHWLMFALLLPWIGDTAAMYAGKTWGRHKLAPVVSPNKTWEGAIASMLASTIGGALYAHYLLPMTALLIALAIAASGNLAGQFGDLAESALKRRAGVKDSGSSLPGHGGWLDRIDAALFAVPMVYLLVRLLPNQP